MMKKINMDNTMIKEIWKQFKPTLSAALKNYEPVDIIVAEDLDETAGPKRFTTFKTYQELFDYRDSLPENYRNLYEIS